MSEERVRANERLFDAVADRYDGVGFLAQAACFVAEVAGVQPGEAVLDVMTGTGAVAAAVALLRSLDVALVSPYPRQVSGSWLERLTQPMVVWSWMATLPMVLAEGTSAVWSAAIGQFLVIDEIGRAHV